jgi:superfamily I DNA and/or RNA helicase
MSDTISLLHLDALPPQTNKGTIVRLLEQLGDLDRLKIGTIEVRGRAATVEVPRSWLPRLIKSLDGAAVGNQFIRARSSATDPAPLPSSTGSPEQHFARLIHLLGLEADAESEQFLRSSRRHDASAAEASGTSLVELVIRDEFLGLGDRVLVTLGKRDVSRRLPWTRLGIGTPVLLSEQPPHEQTGWRGIVSDRSESTIQVALSQSPEPLADRPLFRLDQSSDEVSRQRQRAALERARDASGDRLAQLRDVLLGSMPARFGSAPVLEPLNEQLNEVQRQAVAFAFSAQDVAVLHGPPGTGKTTTVVELIRQAVRRGDKVLACAPSNLAVDNIFERLLAVGERAVRLGHPARVLPELRDHTLDLLVERHPDVKLARKLVREAGSLRAAADKYTRAKPVPGAKKEMRAEARQLLADARRIESLAIQEILDQAQILCATTTGLDSEVLGQRTFDLAVIDEACQSTEPGNWIPLTRSERLVLAGDHQQLPPTVVSADAVREGFSVSLLERLMAMNARGLSRQLTVQYRMHEQIMAFSSTEFYGGSLIADSTVRDHCLSDLPGVTETDSTLAPVTFFDTAGASYEEELEQDGESRLNPQEADVVCRCVEELLQAGLPPHHVAVIAPYAAQVRHLRERLAVSGLEVDTVDGFQGREKEAVVVSLVRSNADGEIGFLADVRRMNVAFTRARRKLIVIGDSATVSRHPFYQRFLEYLEGIGAYRTVWEIV